MLSGDEKWGAYRSAEVFILPSHQENFGIAVVEAMGVGCPVLISDKVNIWREILGDGGGLVQPDTLAGTVALLRQWLDLSVEKQQEMRIKAQNCFTQRYEIHQAAEGLLKLLGTGTTTPTDVHR
jgi:glycosyltransferase involved in cell wall biosynthesis